LGDPDSEHGPVRSAGRQRLHCSLELLPTSAVIELAREHLLGKLALLQSACAVFVLTAFVHSQQFDIAVGDSTLFSSKSTSASQAYLPPPEKGGHYPSVSADFIFKNHFGFNAEIAARAKQGLYNGYQNFRPVLYDANAVFAPRLGERISAELLAGVGGERLLFYNKFSACGSSFPSGCLTYVSSDHFLVHFGGGIRYYFWHNFFIRPEAHLYIIRNNLEFSSGNVGRIGVSIGYTHRSR
jgi:hypothetical protein